MAVVAVLAVEEREREYVCRVYTLYERKGKRENRIGWEGREKEMERERGKREEERKKESWRLK